MFSAIYAALPDNLLRRRDRGELEILAVSQAAKEVRIASYL